MANPKANEEENRRRRYQRSTAQHGMTAAKVRILSLITECGMLTTSQVVRISGLGNEAVYKHLRHLFDLGMLERIAVPYANLAPPGEDGSHLAFGPGQNIHTPTRAALLFLEKAGQISEDALARKLPDYGPRNALFLAHELLVRDVRVWLELCATVHDGRVERWVDGQAAHIPPTRPDAWFLFKISSGTLVGLVEADRGTERGSQWEKKAAEYAALQGSKSLQNATGKRRKSRVLVVTSTEQRRDKLADELAHSPIADSAYIAVVDALTIGGLDQAVWRHRGSKELQPLLPSSLLNTEEAPSELPDPEGSV